MTSDNHGEGFVADRFNEFISMSPSDCSVQNWECIRGTSYVFTKNPLSNVQASSYNSAGFEVALHMDFNCVDRTPPRIKYYFTDQLSAWSAKYTSLPSPVTNRNHCVVWSDYVTLVQVELSHGIRLDTNYYYWPKEWVNNRPGFFTGSGMPMRFADSNGNAIDVYQAATQMTDESGQAYPFTIDTLFHRAMGLEGYYGAFVANFHYYEAYPRNLAELIRSSLAHGIPVISARQMLEWLDGRNSSTFDSLVWDGNTLSFSLTLAKGANGLMAMVPVAEGSNITNVSYNGKSVSHKIETIKGIRYALFSVASGAYKVRYDKNHFKQGISK
jgi:hypothetical protein